MDEGEFDSGGGGGRRRRHSMAAEGGAFNGSSNIQQRWQWGLRTGDDKATMEIDISGGGRRRRVSAFDSGDGQRWALAFGGGDGRQL
jgi:hypothetical protein